MILSILICSLQKRFELLKQLHFHLFKQIYTLNVLGKVEVICNVDNKQKTTGQKRNELLQAARGKYISFIDDDDWVADYYVEEILKAAQSDCDVMAINGVMTTNGINPKRFFHKLGNPYASS